MVEDRLISGIEACVASFSREVSTGKESEIFLVDLAVKAAGRSVKIEVLVDSEQGIVISQCAALSRRIRDMIESDDELQEVYGEVFELMVSSPGLGGPIRHVRQYIRHTGRLLSVRYRDDAGSVHDVTGRLIEVDLAEGHEPFLVLEPVRSGRKKNGSLPPSRLKMMLDRIDKAVVQVEF
ncbi:MAG: ribosome maturation factor RimP [Prosthecochloris sp.]|uniref:Ribosome maturation factor RimP n=1 Tax=Prosthecochloris aestuarii (strain DSM 271 / SK 413) TaxID=290512 RepID=RIMP_PROA2|nr:MULTISPECIES: ribosome maturation factor RimP [Prosthecochloris]B4S4S4.1 RecName: Full=Ribosome maturation factor RimP [Prosthecochloris aestuarii DSM 271]ACF45422.1 protein of unknown function DUF150 [Prosthecochloris aestuarii DSM 271]MCW8798419.1 ribosome maturation factor RimP [Prosthecochloris sp.]